MTHVRTEVIYLIDGLLIEREMLGRSFALDHDGDMLELSLPTVEEEEAASAETHEWFERFSDEFAFPLAEGFQELFAQSASHEGQIASIQAIRLSFEKTIAERTELTAVLEETTKKTDGFVAALFDRLRSIGHQPWLGLTGTSHSPEIWRILNLDERVRYPRPAIAGGSFMVVPPESVLTDLAFCEHLDQLDHEITLARSLLADAEFFRWKHFPEAVAVAVLLAAIACEVDVKDVIRSTAGAKADVAELLLSKPRDFSVAARVLFSEVMSAVNGHSLKADNAVLEKAVGLLFETRNKVAHRGELPTYSEAIQSLETAAKVFEWLDGVRDAARVVPPDVPPSSADMRD